MGIDLDYFRKNIKYVVQGKRTLNFITPLVALLQIFSLMYPTYLWLSWILIPILVVSLLNGFVEILSPIPEFEPEAKCHYCKTLLIPTGHICPKCGFKARNPNIKELKSKKTV